MTPRTGTSHADHIESFLDDLQMAGRRPATIKQRRHLLDRLCRFLDGTPLVDATTEQLRAFLMRPNTRGGVLSQGTRAGEASWIHTFYTWMHRTGRRQDDPTLSIPRPSHPRRLPRPIADADLDVAIALATPTMRSWLMLAAYSGLRAGEIARLQLDDIVFSSKLIVIKDGKGGRPGVIPAHRNVLTALYWSGLPATGWLFPHSVHEGRHVTPSAVSNKAARYLRSLNIDATLHQLRHWFGTRCYQSSGHDLRTTQELLRHSSPVTTAIYTALDPDDGRAAVDAL